MKILGVADFTIDAIYKNKELVKIDGGQTAFNVLYNLNHYYGYKTFAYGNMSADNIGIECAKLFEKQGTNIEFLNKKYKHARILHNRVISLNEKTQNEYYSTSCFECGKNYFQKTKPIDFNKKILQNNHFDIAVFDKPNKDRVKIANYLSANGTTCFLDLGYYSYFKHLSNKKLLQTLNNFTFDFIQFNERVSKYIKERLKLTSDSDIFSLLNSKFISITHGNKGTEIFWRKKDGSITSQKISYKIENVVDTIGAGDAFLAGTIFTYIQNGENFQVYKKQLTLNTKPLVSNVLSIYGARYESKGIQFNFDDDKCQYCGSHIKAKKTKLQTNLDTLIDRIDDAYNTGFEEKLKEFFDKSKRLLLIGAGASYTTANYLRDILEKTGKFAKTITPCDICDTNLQIFDTVVLCSYWGTTPEILNCMRKALSLGKKVGIITGKDTSQFSNMPENATILSYATNKFIREKGFIAVASIIIPAFFVTKIYLKNENIDKFLIDCILDFKKFEIKAKIFKRKYHVVDIFYNGKTETIAKDMESKMVESSFGRVTLHNKKNFSHGRYTTFENNIANLVIYYDFDETNQYEALLMNYLKKFGNRNIIIINPKTENDNLKEFELLLFNQFFINLLDKKVAYEISVPTHSRDSVSLYNFGR